LDTVGEFGERYGTGSGSDLAPSEVVAYKAPGRYRSLYRTNSPTVSDLFDMLFDAPIRTVPVKIITILCAGGAKNDRALSAFFIILTLNHHLLVYLAL